MTDIEMLEIYARNCLGTEFETHPAYKKLKEDFLAGCKAKDLQYKSLLNDIDELLCHLEDFTHGKDGDDITKMRKRIIDFLK